jgi:hypothetical protein
MLSSLDNVGTVAVVDEYGSLNEMKKELEKRMETLRKEILRRVPSGDFVGDAYSVTVSHSKRTTLDTEKIKSVMGDLWVAAHSKTSDVSQITSRKRLKEVA